MLTQNNRLSGERGCPVSTATVTVHHSKGDVTSGSVGHKTMSHIFLNHAFLEGTVTGIRRDVLQTNIGSLSKSRKPRKTAATTYIPKPSTSLKNTASSGRASPCNDKTQERSEPTSETETAIRQVSMKQPCNSSGEVKQRIRSTGLLPQDWCNGCAKQTWVITPEEAVEIVSLSPDCFGATAEKTLLMRNLHYVTTSTGLRLICLKSLFLWLFSVCEGAT